MLFILLFSYEVYIGTSNTSPEDIWKVQNVGNMQKVLITNLNLIPGTKVIAHVRAVNKAKLVGKAASAEVCISPDPWIDVIDGLQTYDIDFQNDLSSISGRIEIKDFCPLVHSFWQIVDLNGNKITNETDFNGKQFQNDELMLTNEQTYFVHVTAVNAENRTIMGRSSGVTTRVMPPNPAEVRDGLTGNINFQSSVSELSFNWDPFGSDIPGLRIVKYRIAIGSNPSTKNGISDVHVFVDAFLNTTYTFTNLDLQAKTVKYYGTVLATAENGAEIQSSSNGIRVGFSENMEAGELFVSYFWNRTDSLSFYWHPFTSDFPILSYTWGISSTDDILANTTKSCEDLNTEFHSWSTVSKAANAGFDTMVEAADLDLQHNNIYFVGVLGRDASDQCIISFPKPVIIDITPPIFGHIKTVGEHGGVQYNRKENELEISWYGFEDPESGISDFQLQLFQFQKCGEVMSSFSPLSGVILLHNNISSHTFYNLDLQLDIEYRLQFNASNGAKLVTSDFSEPIFLETTPPVRGDARVGKQWDEQALYQSSTTTLNAIVALSPFGASFQCPTDKSLIQPVNASTLWKVANNHVLHLHNTSRSWDTIFIEYVDRNVQWQNEFLELSLHRNITTHHLEGGAIIYPNISLIDGVYNFQSVIQYSDQTVFSITLGETVFEEYTSFILPTVEDVMSDEDFLKDAVVDEFVTHTTETHDQATTDAEIPDWLNKTSNIDLKDEFSSIGLGLHILCFPLGNKTKEWKLMVWSRQAEGISHHWIDLPKNPTGETLSTSFQLRHLFEDTWNVQVMLYSELALEIKTIIIPSNVHISMRQWTYDEYIPEVTDPFNPFVSQVQILDVLVPVVKTRPCQFGKPFWDMESGIDKIYFGVSNASGSVANVVPFEESASMCFLCAVPCDFAKCDKDCTWNLTDNFNLVYLELTNLTLDASNSSAESMIEYHIDVMLSNRANQSSIASSDAIIVDITAPVFDYVSIADPLIPDVPLTTNYQSANDSLAAFWEAIDNESPIIGYEVAAGFSENGTELVDFIDVGLEESVHLSNLSLSLGATYYITVRSTNTAGLSNSKATVGVTVADMTPNVTNIPALPINDTSVECFTEACVSASQDIIGISIGKIEDDNIAMIGKL